MSSECVACLVLMCLDLPRLQVIMQTVEGECKAISEQDRAVRDCLAVVVSEAVTDLSRIVVEAEIQDFIQNFMRHRRPRNVVKLLVDDIAVEVVASFVKGIAEVRSRHGIEEGEVPFRRVIHYTCT